MNQDPDKSQLIIVRPRQMSKMIEFVKQLRPEVSIEESNCQKKLRAIKDVIGNVDHTKGHGENSARMRGQMLNDIRELIQAISST